MTASQITGKIAYCEEQIEEAERLLSDLIARRENQESAKMRFDAWREANNAAHSQSLHQASSLGSLCSLKCGASAGQAILNTLQGYSRSKVEAVAIETTRTITDAIDASTSDIEDTQKILDRMNEIHARLVELLQRFGRMKSEAEQAAREEAETGVLSIAAHAPYEHICMVQLGTICTDLARLVRERESIDSANNAWKMTSA